VAQKLSSEDESGAAFSGRNLAIIERQRAIKLLVGGFVPYCVSGTTVDALRSHLAVSKSQPSRIHLGCVTVRVARVYICAVCLAGRDSIGG